MLSEIITFGVFPYLELNDINSLLRVSKVISTTQLKLWREGWINKDKLSLELTTVVKGNNLCNIKYLVNCGASVFYTTLWWCVQKGDLETLQFLIDKSPSNDYTELLNISASLGYFDIVKFLVEKVSVHNCDDALKLASEYGRLEIVKYLLEKSYTFKENHVLCWSAGNGNFELVQFALESGASLNLYGWTALCEASKNGHLHIIKYLVERGVCVVSVVDSLYNSYWMESYPLLVSAENGDLDTVSYLIENGARANICLWRQKKADKNLLPYEVQVLIEKLKYIRYLTIIHKISIEYKYALLWSVRNNYSELMKYFIEVSNLDNKIYKYSC